MITIVCDLGFGDAGKGSITDYLVRATGAKLVVRYNGGAQAGHTVVTSEGRAHTFAQLGSGTFVPGVRTHLSRFVVVHPTGLLVEAARLARLGVTDALDRLSIDPRARVITPYHQAAGRLREIARGAARHGSCGIGVGETVGDSLAHPEDTLYVHELSDPRRKLERIRARKREELPEIDDPRAAEERAAFDDGVAERWIEALAPFRRIALAEDRAPDEPAIFEGAHGVLLDEWRGFHPHTTWSTCTFEHAVELAKDREVVKLGVIRAYATRHGPGPFPTEAPLDLPEPHNPAGAWQGPFRVGWLDAPLLRYALAACGGADALAVTHVDRVRAGWRIATRYDGFEPRLGPHRDLEHQRTLGARVASAMPAYEQTEDVIASIERELGVPVRLTSHGPTASEKRMR